MLIFAMLLSSTTLAHATPFVKDKKNEPPPSPSETRVYIRKQCILSAKDSNQREFFAALAGIFLPLLIKKALGGAAAALKKAGSPETLRDSGRLPTYLYKLSNTVKISEEDGSQHREQKVDLNPDLGCVIVLRGAFSGPDDGDQTLVKFPADDNNGALINGDDTRRIARLNASSIPVTRIDTAYEAAVKISQDNTALYYEGRFLEVNAYQGSRSSKTPRAMVMSLALQDAGSKEGDSTLSLALMNLGDIRLGEVRGPDKLKSLRSSWLGGIGMNETSVKAIEKLEVKDNEKKGIMPVTVEATIVETEAGNATLRFIGDVLDSSKDDLTNTLSGEILKDRDKAAATAATAAADALEKLRQEEEAAYSDFLKADADLIAVTTPTTPAETAARQVKVFERDRTKRLWCVKFGALQKVGAAPTGRTATCP
jgi:hypothetical protein